MSNEQGYLLFRTNTKWQIETIADQKRSPYTDVFVSMRRSLYSKYSYSQNNYYSRDVYMILQNEGKAYVKYKDHEDFDDRECEHLQMLYSKKASMERLSRIIPYYRFHWMIPRFFLTPLSVDYKVEKYYSKKKKLHYERAVRILEAKTANMAAGKQQPPRPNLVALMSKNLQLIQKKLNTYKPILNEVTFVREQHYQTTQIIYEMIKQSAKSSTKQDLIQELEREYPGRFIQEQVTILSFAHHISTKPQSQYLSNDPSPEPTGVQSFLFESKIIVEPILKMPRPQKNLQIEVGAITQFGNIRNQPSTTINRLTTKKSSVPIINPATPQSLIPSRIASIRSLISQRLYTSIANRRSDKPSIATKALMPVLQEKQNHQIRSPIELKPINRVGQAIMKVSKGKENNATPISQPILKQGVRENILKAIYRAQNSKKRV